MYLPKNNYTRNSKLQHRDAAEKTRISETQAASSSIQLALNEQVYENVAERQTLLQGTPTSYSAYIRPSVPPSVRPPSIHPSIHPASQLAIHHHHHHHNHHRSSSIIIHHQLSSSIINYQSSSIIVKNRSSSSVIIHHCTRKKASSWCNAWASYLACWHWREDLFACQHKLGDRWNKRQYMTRKSCLLHQALKALKCWQPRPLCCRAEAPDRCRKLPVSRSWSLLWRKSYVPSSFMDRIAWCVLKHSHASKICNSCVSDGGLLPSLLS